MVLQPHPKHAAAGQPEPFQAQPGKVAVGHGHLVGLFRGHATICRVIGVGHHRTVIAVPGVRHIHCAGHLGQPDLVQTTLVVELVLDRAPGKVAHRLQQAVLRTGYVLVVAELVAPAQVVGDPHQTTEHVVEEVQRATARLSIGPVLTMAVAKLAQPPVLVKDGHVVVPPHQTPTQAVAKPLQAQVHALWCVVGACLAVVVGPGHGVVRAGRVAFRRLGRALAPICRVEAPHMAESVVVRHLASGRDLAQVREQAAAPPGTAQGTVAEHARAVAAVHHERQLPPWLDLVGRAQQGLASDQRGCHASLARRPDGRALRWLGQRDLKR